MALYRALRLTVAGATVVVNSKALYHVLPDLIPPIDPQYTLRFFTQAPEKWRDPKGRFRPIMLPPSIDAQFQIFQTTCVKLKRLVDRVDRAVLDVEQREHGVTPPKAIDNAIVNYVRIVAENLGAGHALTPPA